MLNIEYEIRLNDDGYPYIYLDENYDDKMEDKFMVVELTRYLLLNLLKKKNDLIPEDIINNIKISENTLSEISLEMGEILKDNMETNGVNTINYARKFDMIVDNINELYNLKYNGTIYNNKIIKRVEGLKVLVYDENQVYELKGGIDNKNWKKIEDETN